MSGVSDKRPWVWEWGTQIPEAKKTTSSSIPEWVFDGVKTWVIAALASLAATLNPISPAQASPITIAPISWPQKAWSDLLKQVALKDMPFEAKLTPEQIPDKWLRAAYEEVVKMMNDAEKRWYIKVEWWKFIWMRTWIKWPSELWKVIPFIAEKWEIQTWSFKQITWIDLDALLADMRQNANWTKTPEELKKTLTWQFITSVVWKYVDEITLKHNFDNPAWRWQKSIDWWMTSPTIYDLQRQKFEEIVRKIEERWLLTWYTVYLAHRISSSIAFQDSLLFWEDEKWEVVYKWTKPDIRDSVRASWIWNWKLWRYALASDIAIMQLMTDPNAVAYVYETRVSYGDSVWEIQNSIPWNMPKLWVQALTYWVLSEERWNLSNMVATWQLQLKLAEIKKQIKISDTNITLLDEFLKITDWKKKVAEIKPIMPDLLRIRNALFQSWRYNKEFLSGLDSIILMVEPEAKAKLDQLASR